MQGLAIALALNAAYTVVEAIAGLATDSLALLADAGHNLSDVFALTIASASRCSEMSGSSAAAAYRAVRSCSREGL